jgi:hypothetical protein
MKKELLKKMSGKMPEGQKKDPMLDLEAVLSDIESEKPDSEMNEMAEADSPEYGEEGMEMEGSGVDLASVSEEELQAELDKRRMAGSKKSSMSI